MMRVSGGFGSWFGSSGVGAFFDFWDWAFSQGSRYFTRVHAAFTDISRFCV